MAKLLELLGIILFMLYRGQQVVREAFYLFESSESKKFELIFEDEIIFRGSQIIGKTSDKVLKYDKSNNLYKVMSNESVLNTIKNYLQNLWRQKIQHMFDIFEMISVIIMLTVAIITNTSISQVVFIPLIFVFVLISFFSSAYISLNRETYYRKHREYNNEQTLIINDLLRVPVIVKNDLDMRIDKFQKTVIASNENITNFHKKMNLSRLFVTTIEAFSQYGIIIFYLLGIEWSSISLATITEITATLLIVETALGQIGRIAETLNNHNERLIILEKEENDKPFTLISNERIDINKGEVVILYGPSGSGKSTFMKMLTERIRLEKSTEIPSTSRFLFYDEKLRFGSLSIFE